MGDARRHREGASRICTQNSTGGRNAQALVVITGILSYNTEKTLIQWITPMRSALGILHRQNVVLHDALQMICL